MLYRSVEASVVPSPWYHRHPVICQGPLMYMYQSPFASRVDRKISHRCVRHMSNTCEPVSISQAISTRWVFTYNSGHLEVRDSFTKIGPFCFDWLQFLWFEISLFSVYSGSPSIASKFDNYVMWFTFGVVLSHSVRS